MNEKLLLYYALLLLISLCIAPSAFGVECGNSLFQEDSLASEVKNANNRFQSLTRSFKPDNNVDIIFEVPIEDRSVAEIEQIVTDSKSQYFVVANNSLGSGIKALVTSLYTGDQQLDERKRPRNCVCAKWVLLFYRYLVSQLLLTQQKYVLGSHSALLERS